MKKLVPLLILGLIAASAGWSAHAAPAGSDWPSLNYDAAQSNDNVAEQTLNARNVLKIKVRWTAPLPSSVSYPVVAGGRVYIPILSHGSVHVRALDASTGKPLATYPKDALGGILAAGGNLYLAGHVIQVVDAATGKKLVQINPPSGASGTFVNPIGDRKIVVTGYAGSSRKTPTQLYGIDPQTYRVLWRTPSISATGAIATGRVLTETAGGSEFYDESSGKGMVRQPDVHSDWFAGPVLAYTVASLKRGNATLYAFDGTGQKMWSRSVGPFMVTRGWAHALSSDSLYVQTIRPQPGVEALDPESGQVQWARRVANVQRIVLANDLLYVLTYSLGQPVRLIVLHASNGTPVGVIQLSSGYYAFNEQNGLIVANGMVFLRAVGPGGSQLVALGQ